MPINKELAAERTTFPEGHVIRMTVERVGADRHMVSLAACECGWQNTAPWPGHHVDQDEAMERHWQETDSPTVAPPPG